MPPAIIVTGVIIMSALDAWTAMIIGEMASMAGNNVLGEYHELCWQAPERCQKCGGTFHGPSHCPGKCCHRWNPNGHHIDHLWWRCMTCGYIACTPTKEEIRSGLE